METPTYGRYLTSDEAKSGKYTKDQVVTIPGTNGKGGGIRFKSPDVEASATAQKTSNGTTIDWSQFNNIPKEYRKYFDGMNPDQLMTADASFLKASKIDSSTLTDSEIAGFVQDAHNENDPFYNTSAKNITDQAKINSDTLASSVKDTLTGLGITNTNLQADVSRNIVRAQADQQFNAGQINKSEYDAISSAQDSLEGQGLTFSGAAVKQLGDQAAVGANGVKGSIQQSAADSTQKLATDTSRAIQDQNTTLQRQGSSLAAGTDYNNLTPDQVAGLGNSDIDRAIAAAYSRQGLGARQNALDTSIAKNNLQGNYASDFLASVNEKEQNAFNLGRSDPGSAHDNITPPTLAFPT